MIDDLLLKRPRPRAIVAADQLLNRRMVCRTWTIERLERIRNDMATVDDFIRDGRYTAARDQLLDLDVVLDVYGRCLAGDLPGAEDLADSIMRGSKAYVENQ